MTLDLSNHHDTRFTHTLHSRQMWAQIGWVDQEGNVYAPGLHDWNPTSPLTPLWILLEDELPADAEGEER